jgi:hypothetical protein
MEIAMMIENVYFPLATVKGWLVVRFVIPMGFLYNYAATVVQIIYTTTTVGENIQYKPTN